MEESKSTFRLPWIGDALSGSFYSPAPSGDTGGVDFLFLDGDNFLFLDGQQFEFLEQV